MYEIDGMPADIYTPDGKSYGTVILVAGYPDPGFEKFVGCRFKDMPSTIAWGQRIAASGLTAIAYSNREPVADLHTVVRHAEPPVSLWASSGNAPLALSLLMHDAPASIACAALCYPYTLDLDGHTHVASAASTFHFTNPCAGRTMDDLRTDVPLLLARAGRDEFPGLNDTLDRFAFRALERNLPLTLINHPTGPHAFDLHDDSATTRGVIAQVLSFLSP